MTSRRARLSAAVRIRLVPIGWLTFVWVVLWGTLSPANVLSGIVVASAVTFVLPLPVVRLGVRLRIRRTLVFLWHFLWDLLLASVQVAVLSLRTGPPIRSSIIAVQLRSRSELHLALTSQTISLTPGSLVVEIDAEHSIVYAHVLDTDDDAKVAAFRAHTAVLEARIIRAIGSDRDVRALDEYEGGASR